MQGTLSHAKLLDRSQEGPALLGKVDLAEPHDVTPELLLILGEYKTAHV